MSVVRTGRGMISEKLLLVEFENGMGKWSAVSRRDNMKICDRHKQGFV